MPSARNSAGEEVAATKGVVSSMMWMLREGATHVAVATDHVIESFRNDLWPGYKTGEGIEPELFAQFPLLEEALESLGLVVWKMVEHEADDGMAAGAVMAKRDPRVEQILLCTPDKDLAQCVQGDDVVQVDRRRRLTINEQGVWDKYGVAPKSIPDYLALVGDSADGFPGLKGWGAKSASTLLARYEHLDQIPLDAAEWDVKVRASAKLAETLAENLELALLFRHLATSATDAPVSDNVDELMWQGPRADFAGICERIGGPELVKQAQEIFAPF